MSSGAAAPDRSGENPRPVDGASAERTRLAWRRTALSVTPVALLAVRLAVRDGMSAGSSLAIAAAALGWVGSLWLAQRRIHAMATREPRNIGRTLPAIAVVTAGFAVLGIVLVMVKT